MYGVIELGPSALTEVEMYARGLFDESKVNRDESGEFAKKSGPSASLADEPFALGGSPKHGKGRHESHEKQGSLFDKDLHGAEARDLPGQTNFLGDDADPPDTPERSGIDKTDAPAKKSLDEHYLDALEGLDLLRKSRPGNGSAADRAKARDEGFAKVQPFLGRKFKMGSQWDEKQNQVLAVVGDLI